MLHVTVALITRNEICSNLKDVEKCRVEFEVEELSHDVQVASRPQI